MGFRPRLEPVLGEDDRRTLLDLLNGKLLEQDEQASFWSVSLAQVRATPLAYKRATAEVQRIISERLDEWLASGRTNDSETPEDRKLTSDDELFDMISEYSNMARPNFKLAEDTGLPIAYLDSLRWGEGSLVDNYPLEEDPIRHAYWEAVRVLAIMMLSDDCRSGIAKCRLCRTYFFLPHKSEPTKQRRIYPNGCFCSTKHYRAFTADRRKKAERERIHSKKIQLAGQELSRLKRHRNDEWYEDNDLKNKLVNAVNRHSEIRRDPRLQIAVNFISRHKRKIHENATLAIRN